MYLQTETMVTKTVPGYAKKNFLFCYCNFRITSENSPSIVLDTHYLKVLYKL